MIKDSYQLNNVKMDTMNIMNSFIILVITGGIFYILNSVVKNQINVAQSMVLVVILAILAIVVLVHLIPRYVDSHKTLLKNKDTEIHVEVKNK